MSRLFQKKIPLEHTYRNYDSDISSKRDVMPSLTLKTHSVKKLHRTQSDYFPLFNKLKIKRISTKDAAHPPSHDISEQTDEEELEAYKANFAFFKYHNRKMFFTKKSLYILDANSKLRQFAVWLTESKLFELLTVSIIIANAVFLGLRDFTEEKKENTNDIYGIIEPIFAAYNILEACLKIIARGFSQESNSYIKDGMNGIDLFVAVTGVFYFTDHFRYFSILRLPRVLLFFKHFKLFKTINQMMKVLINSSWTLVIILSFLLFFFILSAIFGLHLFAGKLDSRCRLTPLPINGYWPTTNHLHLCGSGLHCTGNTTCGSNFKYSDMLEGDLNRDTYYEEFNYGLTTFDNIFLSLFTVFIINNGNWRYLTLMLSDASDNWVTLIYCSLTYIICNFFILQIAVAVMLDEFSKNNDNMKSKASLATLMLKGDRIDDKTSLTSPDVEFFFSLFTN
jgi:Ion transport protein.